MTLQSLPRAAVTNLEIEQLIAMRETQKSLKDRLALMDQSIDQLSEKLIGLVDSGADLSQCGYHVSIQTSERRYPAWKEHFISRLGKADADDILEATTPVIHRKLVIK